MSSVSNPLGNFTGTTSQITSQATNLFKSMDTSGRGFLTKANFATLLAEAKARQSQPTSDFGATATQWNIGREIWNVGQSTYVGTSGGAARQSPAQTAQLTAKTFTQVDTDSSGNVTLEEFINGILGVPPATPAADTKPTTASGTTPEPTTATDPAADSTGPTTTPSAGTGQTPSNTPSDTPTTPLPYPTASSLYQQAHANSVSMLSKYDLVGKGYIDQTDLMTAWIADPTLGNPLQAASTIAQWDTNGDKKVTPSELTLGATVANIAGQIQAMLDPSGQGFIPTSQITHATAAGLPYSPSTIQAWDKNGLGQLSSQELIAGVNQSLNAFIAQFDTANKGYFTVADVHTAMNAHPSGFGGVSAADLVARWDLKGDGQIDASEIATVQLTAIQANNTPNTPPLGSTTAVAVLQSAKVEAASMLGQYDKTNKGFITQADLVTAFSNDPSLGDPAQAGPILAAFDLNGDGQLSQDELINGGQLQTLASQILSALDPKATETVKVTDVTAMTNSSLPFSAPTIAGWDGDGDGQISRAEVVLGIYKEVQNTIAQFDASGKGYFTRSDVQNAMATRPPADPAATADSVMSQWDVSGSGQVAPSDLLATLIANVTNTSAANATPAQVSVYTNAQASANAMLSSYDTMAKGYIDQTDIVAACLADPALGDPSQASSIISAWDANKNGHLTSNELVSGLIAGQIAGTLLAQLDPSNSGSIQVDSLAARTVNAPFLSKPAAEIAAWDSDGDGAVSQQELVTGICQKANNFISQYDTAGKGYFTAADIQRAIAANPNAKNVTASGVISQWDANTDGHVTPSDALAGFAVGLNATSLMTATSALTWTSNDLPSTAQVLAAMGLNIPTPPTA